MCTQSRSTADLKEEYVAMIMTLTSAVSSGAAIGAAAGLIALGLVLLFLWAIYKRGGIDHLAKAAKAIRGLVRRKR